jgi:hypothetical protein
MSEATAALIVAIVGAATGLAALVWNVVSWQRQGPNVTLQAWFSDDQVAAYIWNTGRADAHITHLQFRWLGPDDALDDICFANVAASNVTPPDYRHVPANGGSVHITITNLADVSGGLLSTLRLGIDGVVLLFARTGPYHSVSTVISHDLDRAHRVAVLSEELREARDKPGHERL